MTIYTVRRALTNATTATTNGQPLSTWSTYAEARKETERLFACYLLQTYITTEVK